MTQNYIILLISILLAVCGQLLLKKGMLVLGSLDFSIKNIIYLLINIFKNFYIIIGLFFYGISLIFWLFALSKLKLSVAYPATSLMYVFIILSSWLIFKETVNFYQWLGVIFILFGLFFIFVKGSVY